MPPKPYQPDDAEYTPPEDKPQNIKQSCKFYSSVKNPSSDSINMACFGHLWIIW